MAWPKVPVYVALFSETEINYLCILQNEKTLKRGLTKMWQYSRDARQHTLVIEIELEFNSGEPRICVSGSESS